MRRLCSAIVGAYVIACVLALGWIPATAYGLFGIAPNPFAALGAVILGLPWSPLAALIAGDSGAALSVALIAAGMALNAALLRWLCRRIARRRADRQTPA